MLQLVPDPVILSQLWEADLIVNTAGCSLFGPHLYNVIASENIFALRNNELGYRRNIARDKIQMCHFL